MAVLSIQSHVVAGYVGNSAAVFCLQRAGVECWGLDTLQFSNHTGYPGFTGEVFSTAHLSDIVAGLEKYAGLGQCEAVLSGYLGSAGQGNAVLQAVENVRRVNPRAVYCCDPVMGDECGLYVAPEIPEFMRSRALAAADIIVPNHFELELLSGRRVFSCEEAVDAARSLMQEGRTSLAVVTSLTPEENRICVLAVSRSDAFRVVTPKIEFGESVDGAGDITASLFLAEWLKTKDAARALAKSVSSVYGIIRMTTEMKKTQVQLIAAQNEISSPSVMFNPERI